MPMGTEDTILWAQNAEQEFKMSKTIRITGLIVIFYVSAAFSASQLTEDDVYNLFIASEFHKARALMETYVASHTVLSHQDSVVWLKYMGAIALNNPDSADRAEIYWRELLSIRPDANIDNLMLPNEYDALFERLKNEVTAGAPPIPEPEPIFTPVTSNTPESSAPAPTSKKGNAWAWWTTGGVILVGAATALTIVIIKSNKPPNVINPPVPADNSSSSVSSVLQMSY